MNFHTAGDPLESLPIDQTPPSHEEIALVDTLFKERISAFHKLLSGAKDALFVGLMFVAISLPIVDVFLKRFMPLTESPYTMIAAKALLFAIVYFILSRMYLVRIK